MPFHLTFNTKVVILVEIGESSPRIALFQPSQNEEELRVNLDLLQEAREVAHVKEYAIEARADLVLRKITRTMDNNKLTPNWEGSFRIIEDVGKGAYRLKHLDGKRIPRTWNVANL
ncbi:hypothetical protein CR513_28302, partial [Mucuna pruriens]